MKNRCILHSEKMVFYCILKLQQALYTYLMDKKRKKDKMYSIFNVKLLEN